MANKNLSATISIGGVVAGSLINALGTTKGKLLEVGKAIGDLTRRSKLLGEGIDTFGRMGKNVDGLRAKYTETIKTIDQLRAAQGRLNASVQTHAKLTAVSGKMAAASASTGIAGGAMLASVVPGVKEAKHYETESSRVAALGMGPETTKAGIEFSKAMKTFGTSQLENLELMRDGMSVFADLHHAEMVAPLLSKMKFGNKAMFGNERGEEQSKQFMDMLKVIETRGGLSSKEEFNKQANIIQQVISATGGRVTATEWRNLISTGGLAAKGMKDEALYYTMEHLVQEQGGDKVGTGLSALYSSLYQGRTTKRAAMNLDAFGLIGDKSKVKHDKAGQVSFLNPGALLGGQTLRDNPFEWMEKVMLPAMAKKGITDKDKILDAIGAMVSNKKGGDILAAMYMQRAQIHKSEGLNRGAHNIDQLDAEGRQTAGGKELEMQAKLADLKLRLGTQILPIYARALETVTSGLERLNAFTDRNPTLAKAMVIGVAAVGAALLVATPLLLAGAGAVSIYANMQLLAATRSAAAATAIAATGPAVTSLIAPVLGLGAAIMATPIGWIAAGVAAIAVAGIMIYKYWEPLKAFFVGFGEGLTAAFAPVINLIAPIVMPIFEKIGSWAKSAAAWFGDLLTPIDKLSSTTKAFGDAGVTVGKAVAGAFRLIIQPVTAVIDAMKWVSDHMPGSGVKVVPGQATTTSAAAMNPTAQEPKKFDMNSAGLPAAPALASGSAGAAAGPTTITNDIKIVQQPGQSNRDLAAEVAKEIDRRNGVARRSSMVDGAGSQ